MTYQPPHKRNQKAVPAFSNRKEQVSTHVAKLVKTEKKEEFPELCSTKKVQNVQQVTPQVVTQVTQQVVTQVTQQVVTPSVPQKPMMNFASLFKNAIKKKKPKPMKWGMVLLTKKGVVDSLTPEEREEQKRAQEEELQEALLVKTNNRLETQRNIRREFDANYESPPELTVSTSEEELTEEEEEIDEDFEEDEFEPEN